MTNKERRDLILGMLKKRIEEEGIIGGLLSDPTANNLVECLLYLYLEGGISSKQEEVIKGYFKGKGNATRSIVEILNNCDRDELKPITRFFNGDTKSIQKPFGFQMTKILVGIREEDSFESQQDEFDLINESALLTQIREYYKVSADFNEIRITGDVHGDIGVLSMSDYYVHLSYTDIGDLSNKESLLKMERELSFSQSITNAVHLIAGDMSRGRIVNNTLFNTHRIVITGNPGVGKSTFAKWLCYQWAHKGFQKDEKTPIYIPLRELFFNRGDFILDYLKETYFRDIASPKMSLRTLTQELENYQLILDGFDELSFENQEQLIKVVRPFNYTILTRPMGLLYHSITHDISLQIDGFDNDARSQYLKTIIGKSRNVGKSLDEILDIISENKVLRDYSFVPLMLSYMALIYITSKDVDRDLSSIKSVYDLQDRVYDWIVFYARQKLNIPRLEDSVEKMEAFAYHLQTQKQFTYIGSPDDPYFDVTDLMAKIGLGSKRKIIDGYSYSWQFSFNTITFQEFLSARYFEKKKPSGEAVVYLITDHFFWNFSIMFFGLLMKKRKFNLAEESLNFLLKMASPQDKGFYRFAYYMFLAECSEEMIQKHISTKDVLTIMSFYREVYFDQFWQKPIYKSIQKILNKNQGLQSEFVFQTMRYIDHSGQIQSHDDEESFFYVSDFIKFSLPYNADAITDAVIKAVWTLTNEASLLDDILTRLDTGDSDASENEQYLTELKLITCRNLIRGYLSDFYNFPHEQIVRNAGAIEEILTKNSLFNTTILKFIQVYTKGVDLVELQNSSIKVRELLRSHNLDSKAEQEYVIDVLTKVSEEIFLYLQVNKDVEEKNKEILSALVEYISTWILENYAKIQEALTDSTYEYLIDLNVNNLALVDDPRLFNPLCDFIIAFEEFGISGIGDRQGLQEFVDELIEEFKNSISLEKVKKIRVMIALLRADAREYLSVEKVLDVIVSLIHNAVENNNIEDDQGLQKVLTSLLESQVSNYAKKSLLDYLIIHKLDENPFVVRELILSQIAQFFVFYEDRYWKKFFQYMGQSDWSVEYTASLLLDEDLYLFESNRERLCELFIKTFKSKKSKDYFEEYGEVVLFACGLLLLHIKSCKEELKAKVVETAYSVLHQKSGVDTFENIIDLNIVEASLAYILLYFFEPSKKNHLYSVDLFERLHNEPGAKVALMDYLIQFSENPHYGIEINEIEAMKPVLGDQFFDEFMTLLENRLVHKNVYSPDYLEMLIQNQSIQ